MYSELILGQLILGFTLLKSLLLKHVAPPCVACYFVVKQNNRMQIQNLVFVFYYARTYEQNAAM